MAMHNDFEEFLLDMLEIGKFQWRDYEVDVHMYKKGFRRKSRDEAIDMYGLRFALNGETQFLAMIPESLFPKRIYIIGNKCRNCKNDCCRESEVVISMNGEVIPKTIYDVHQDSCRECELRNIVLSFFRDRITDIENQADATRDMITSLLTAIFQAQETDEQKETEFLSEDVQEDEVQDSEPDQEPELKDPFYVEHFDGYHMLHFVKHGNECKRKVKGSDAYAEKALQGLRDLENGQSSDNRLACAIWNVKTKSQNVYEELFEISQNDNKELQQEIERLKRENSVLQEKNAALEKRSSGSDGNGILTIPEMNEIYKGEVKFHVMKALQEYVAKSSGDLRSTAIIAQLVECNENTDVEKYYKSLFDRACGINVPIKERERLFSMLGYEMDNRNGGHYLVYPKGHKELACTMSATPSDHRSSKNTVTQLMNKLFS